MMMMTVMVMMEISKINCVKQSCVSSYFKFHLTSFGTFGFQVLHLFVSWFDAARNAPLSEAVFSLKLSHSLFEITQTPLSWWSVFKQHQTTWKLWHLLN